MECSDKPRELQPIRNRSLTHLYLCSVLGFRKGIHMMNMKSILILLVIVLAGWWLFKRVG